MDHLPIHHVTTPDHELYFSNHDVSLPFLETTIPALDAMNQMISVLMMHSTFLSMIGDLHTLLTNQPAPFSPFIAMLYAIHSPTSPHELPRYGPWPAYSYAGDITHSAASAFRQAFNALWSDNESVMSLRFQCASQSFLVTKQSGYSITFRRLVPPTIGHTILTIDYRVLLILSSLVSKTSFSSGTFRPISASTSIDFVNVLEFYLAYSNRQPGPIFRTLYPVSSYTPTYAFQIAEGTTVHYGLQCAFYRMVHQLFNAATSNILMRNTGYVIYDSFPFTCLPLCSHTFIPKLNSTSRVYQANFMLEIDLSYFRIYKHDRPHGKHDNPLSIENSLIVSHLTSLSQELFDKIFLNVMSLAHNSSKTPSNDEVLVNEFPESNKLYILVRPPRQPLPPRTNEGFDFGHSLRIQVPITLVLHMSETHQQSQLTKALVSSLQQFNPSILYTDFHISQSRLAPFYLKKNTSSPACSTNPTFPQALPSLLRSLDSNIQPGYNWCCNNDLDVYRPTADVHSTEF